MVSFNLNDWILFSFGRKRNIRHSEHRSIECYDWFFFLQIVPCFFKNDSSLSNLNFQFNLVKIYNFRNIEIYHLWKYYPILVSLVAFYWYFGHLFSPLDIGDQPLFVFLFRCFWDSVIFLSPFTTLQLCSILLFGF